MTVHDDAQLISLKVSDDFNPWCAAGFNVVESNQGTSTTHIGEVLLRFQEEPLEQGIYAIGTKNLEGVFDGLTFFVDPKSKLIIFRALSFIFSLSVRIIPPSPVVTCLLA